MTDDTLSETPAPHRDSPAERERLDAMLASVDVGLWYCDLPFDELQWDRKVKEHFWLPADARVTIDTFYGRLHPDDRERTRSAIDHSIATRQPYDIEYRTLAAPDSPDAGAARWVRAIGYTAYGADGTPVRFDGITVDVTAQKNAEAALAESEERFRRMADNAPVMIWVTEPADGRCSFLNQQWYDFTGQTPATGLGFGWLDAVHPDDREASGRVFLEANARHAPFRIDYRLRRRDGVYRWAVDAAAPRFGPGGEFRGYIGSVIDIHERKEAEAERERLLEAERGARAEAEMARAEAERANRAKSEFLAVMSHELRTPLNAIAGYVDLMRLGVPEPVPAAHLDHLERIQRSQQHLLGLINSVLNYARVEAGRLEYRVDVVPVGEILASIEPLVTPQVAARSHTYQCEPCERTLRVHADREKVVQVLLNLVSNAVKFTPPGGRVTLQAEGAGDRAVAIRVRDTGIGVPPDKRRVIFDPFVQVDARLTREAGGAGLGLAISRDLARGMGGELTLLWSEEGAGSEFELRLVRAG